MKNIIKKFITVLVLIMVPVISLLSQPAAPSAGFDATHWGPTGGTLSCPVGNGYYILIALALCYGIYKIWQTRKAGQIA